MSRYNVLNQLIQRGGSGTMLVTGKVNRPGTVWINGEQAEIKAVGQEVYFQKLIEVQAGTNELTVKAKDKAGKEREERHQFEVQEKATAMEYDARGNLVSDGVRRYEWDIRNWLVGVKLGAEHYEWMYDSQGRRVVEKRNGAIVKRWIWDGLELIQERDGSGKVTKNFFQNGLQIGGKSYVYTRDHLGSIREVICCRLRRSVTSELRMVYFVQS